jgi:inosine/xanthosine triphosphate pyrophosphatase family protein
VVDRVQVVLATQNRGKRSEWAAMLKGLALNVVLPEEVGVTAEIEETGET